jgi:hypothetical protein
MAGETVFMATEPAASTWPVDTFTTYKSESRWLALAGTTKLICGGPT